MSMTRRAYGCAGRCPLWVVRMHLGHSAKGAPATLPVTSGCSLGILIDQRGQWTYRAPAEAVSPFRMEDDR